MKIVYENKKVEKIFCNYTLMQRSIGFEMTKSVKKIIGHLKAADTFGTFLKLGLHKPEPLEGNGDRWSLRINPNVRLIIQLNSSKDTVTICEEIKVKGVCDYHGDKENWYIH